MGNFTQINGEILRPISDFMWIIARSPRWQWAKSNIEKKMKALI
jgi:hypothetical protein